MKVFLILATFCLPAILPASKIPMTKLHSHLLDADAMKMSWLIDWQGEEVFFHVRNAFRGDDNWFYLGFSKRGDLGEADLCVFQLKNSLFNIATDAYTSPDSRTIFKDASQDCELLRIDDNSVAFKRRFNTCDPQDLKMHEGTMYIAWARGQDDFELLESIDMDSLHPAASDVTMMQLLRADKINIPEKTVEHVEIALDKVTIPNRETTYWCLVQKLPEFLRHRKHHVVQFEPIIAATSRPFVHHMEVFHCDTDASLEIPSYNGDCTDAPPETKVCSKVSSLWAMGASTFTYPPETGLPIGGQDYNPFMRLEVHFNNPDLVNGTVDSSGMRLKIVSKLRKFDAAVMELGLEYTDKMAIPPGQVGFPLSGYCIAECTKAALPPQGITVFGSQLHTHLRGVRVLTRHFRGLRELHNLNRDDFYSHHFQEIRQLRRKPVVKPGDALVTTCYYNTLGYRNTTLGGFSISDEMCVNYIHYYPATKLEVCKSSVSERTLSDYFRYMRKREHQKLDHRGARSDNYRAIQWTKARVDILYTMYMREPLSMQCNRSDGHRFEGFAWEDAPVTPVPFEIPLERESCSFRDFWTKPLAEGQCDLLGECIY
ncbi:tyramine beta-hydroxylase [Phlebotomus argentipes]|uniref:tyramine beta-hydroxylase n=1 Tax=Phlebotomus argentipes TaxID=94469 RepID=UPI002892D688|nr:tyramine beta-hydroxylase [Phlebotomus argentipes]